MKYTNRRDFLKTMGVMTLMPKSDMRFKSNLHAKLRRFLYVADTTDICVYDIDDDHQLVKKITIPEAGNYKGICASPALRRLYITSHVKDDLICIDLLNDKVIWRKEFQWGHFLDSLTISPDGLTLYVPCRDSGEFYVLDARDGKTIGWFETGKGERWGGPHNSWYNKDGSRVYMSVLTHPYIYVADTTTHQITKKIGPFTKGIRPFAVTADESLVYVNVDRLLGFEIGDIATGKMLDRIEAKTPLERLLQVKDQSQPHATPSHGIGLHPDQHEIWVCDDVFGYLYVYDVSNSSPRQIATIPLFEDPTDIPQPSWISFSIDGTYAYPSCNAVIDTQTKEVVYRIPTSEKLIEIDFLDGIPVQAGHR